MGKPTAADLLGIMDDGELSIWNSPNTTPQEQDELQKALTAEWEGIPDPSDEDLQPPFMRPENWMAIHDGRAVNRKQVRNAAIRHWKKLRRKRGASQGMELSELKKRFEEEEDTNRGVEPRLEDTLKSIADTVLTHTDYDLEEQRREIEKTLEPPRMPEMERPPIPNISGLDASSLIDGLHRKEDRELKKRELDLREQEIKKSQSPPQETISEHKHHESNTAPRVLIGGMVSAVGTLILNELHVPLWLTVPVFIALLLCFWQWPFIARTKRRQAAFYVLLGLYAFAVLAIIVVPLVQRAKQPIGKVYLQGGETVTARIRSWGTSGEHDVFAVVNTAEFAPLAEDYRLMIVCRAQDNKIDGKDDLRIDKSGLFSIAGNNQRLEVTLSQDTMRRIVPDGWVNIYILIVPTKVNPKELRTITELTQNGAYIVGNPSLFVQAIIENKSGRLVGG